MTIRTTAAGLMAVIALGATGAALAPAAQAAVLGYKLEQGHTLGSGDELDSMSGAYRFVVQDDGNAVLYAANGAPLWSTGTWGHPGASLTVQPDGNAVLYTADNRPLWSTGTYGRSVSDLTVQDDGNLVLSGTDGLPTWSRTAGVIEPPAVPVGTSLPAGTGLNEGNELLSNQALVTGPWQAEMQPDGNLVVSYNGRPQWSTGTWGHPGAFLAVQLDGNTVLYTHDGQPLWTSGTFGRSAGNLVMQSDGNLVRYGTDNVATWSRTTGTIPVPPTFVGSSLPAGNVLLGNQGLGNGSWQAVMQPDGNLVVSVNGRPQWSTGTWGNPGAFLSVQWDGNAVLYSADWRPLWTSGTYGSSVGSLVMQTDGNLVLYGSDGRATWSRMTGKLPRPSDKGWVLQSYTISSDSWSEFAGTARITNTNGSTLYGGWTITVFAGGRQVGVLEGLANEVAPGQTVTVTLLSTDAWVPGPYQIDFQTDYSF